MEEEVHVGLEMAAQDGGDPCDGGPPSGCIKRWKAAAADSAKPSLPVFDETGIFASACRHGFSLWVADMVRSGELAKYGLAIVAKGIQLLQHYSRYGYDIRCSLSTVLSSALAQAFRDTNSGFCVNVFHGYAHNYGCQTTFHPNNIVSMGLIWS